MGWGGGCINVLTTTSLILRIDHTCRGSLEVALDATSTFMTWGGVGWGAKININVYTDGCQSWKDGRQRKPQATLGGEVRGPHA